MTVKEYYKIDTRRRKGRENKKTRRRTAAPFIAIGSIRQR